MSAFGMTTTVPGPFGEAKARVTQALAAEGFGILTQIDMSATLAAKIGVTIEPYEILGACNPTLANRALEVDRSIGLLLPCTVVLRQVERSTGSGAESGAERGAEPGTESATASRVEVSILDPEAMFGVVGEDLRGQLSALVADARSRLTRALAALDS